MTKSLGWFLKANEFLSYFAHERMEDSISSIQQHNALMILFSSGSAKCEEKYTFFSMYSEWVKQGGWK